VIQTRGSYTADGILVDARSEVSAALNANSDETGGAATKLLKGITISKESEMLYFVADTGFGKRLVVKCPVAPGKTTFIIDGEARLAYAVAGNGRLWDGGDVEEVGWQRIDPEMEALGGCDLQCTIPVIRYDRALLVSEAVAVSRWYASGL